MHALQGRYVPFSTLVTGCSYVCTNNRVLRVLRNLGHDISMILWSVVCVLAVGCDLGICVICGIGY